MDPNYESRHKDLFPGGVRGNVVAMDPYWSHVDPSQFPWYTGEFRMLGSLVWSDLYALNGVKNHVPDMWAEASQHPLHIYTGSTIPS